MFDWLARLVASTTTTITFFTIFLVGVVFSAFSLILGGHGDADHDVDGDVGMDHDTDVDHGGDHDGGDHDGDGGIGSGMFSVGMLSVRGVALLATGFGGIGFLVYSGTEKIFFSTATALVGGYIFAFIVLFTMKVFKSQQANSLIATAAAVGTDGIVTVSIPENGLGEVSLLISGVEMFRPARSEGGGSIRSGTRIRVREVSGGTCVVIPSPAASNTSNHDRT